MAWEDDPEIQKLTGVIGMFASAIRQKVLNKADQGEYGWNHPSFIPQMMKDLEFDIGRAREGDPNQFVDIAARAMFLWYQQMMKQEVQNAQTLR